jgi:poly-gamma-glutamate capsule biosynthesis protein CapA/YwtB (metallophosphatase superfamily)
MSYLFVSALEQRVRLRLLGKCSNPALGKQARAEYSGEAS